MEVPAVVTPSEVEGGSGWSRGFAATFVKTRGLLKIHKMTIRIAEPDVKRGR